MAIEQTRRGRLLHIKLNRPEKRNALDLQTCLELITAFDSANRDDRIGALLLSGAGKAFCSGMDLSEATDSDSDELASAHERLFTIFDWAEKPLIAAVHGAALAGGTGLCANAHVVIASDDALFGLTEIRIGLWPVLIFPAIVRSVGERRAIELALSGRTFGAPEAERFGLASEVVAAGKLDERANEVATGLAEASIAAIRSGLEYVRAIHNATAEQAMRIGRETRHALMRGADWAEGLRAFREKRAPSWPSQQAGR